MINLLGMVFICIGLAIFLLGMLCFGRCQSFEGKLLSTSIIDAAGLLTFMIGVVLCFGIGINALKAVMILLTILIISPITAHEIARLFKMNAKEELKKMETEEDDKWVDSM